ncbi:GNAT family N-acetyltransferase [Nakamurella sp. YIM 132087]|uniref:GNAT family N-acetyltransferase n=1 Tax=Nakamurella alba TaxID=2665158 RepID=A0A7K1FI20_9ACTN|nr:GNAT family N-acetyltransferase [Nakamurella alba]MTD13730.1 GNAT family N-acetyltransferase [Nakamurella alba]
MIGEVMRAGLLDADVVARLQLDLWQQAYAELLPPAVLATPLETLFDRWTARIAGGGPVLVAMEGGTPVGLAALSALPVMGVGEIEVFGVLPRFARRGHGGRMLAEAATQLRDTGAHGGRWWAPEEDRTIERFLASAGWQPEGRRRVLDTGTGRFAEVAYSGGLDLVAV